MFTEAYQTKQGLMHVYHEQYVCVDCVMFIANGDLPEDEEDASCLLLEFDRYAQENIEWRLGSCKITLEDGIEVRVDLEDLDFSKAECDCCGSSLAGSRHPAHFVTQG